MKLVIGLGNPEKKYDYTRHNIGFMVIDKLCEKLNIELTQTKFKGLYCLDKKTDTIYLKPQTYMNLSGEAVVSFVQYFKIDTDDILVIYDDLDLPLGKIRIREKGSSGGQKGMKNIIDLLKTQNIKRIRLGIGNNKLMENYVLSKFRADEKNSLDSALNNAVDAIITYQRENFQKAMNIYNKNEA